MTANNGHRKNVAYTQLIHITSNRNIPIWIYASTHEGNMKAPAAPLVREAIKVGPPISVRAVFTLSSLSLEAHAL